MIRVTKFDGRAIMLNADWIQSIEETPDTLITLTTGFQLLVRDKIQDVVNAFMEYKRNFHQAPTTQGIEEFQKNMARRSHA